MNHSLNHIFVSVWSESLKTWVAAPETCRKQGKSKQSSRIKNLLCACLCIAASTPSLAELSPDALPTGGQVVMGNVGINQQAASMVINQSTDRAIVNWSGFNIGSSASVQINQPSATAAMLNRVTGADPSKIFGQLKANGQVVLINPNGVLFGESSRIDVGSLVAATLNLSNEDFLAARYHFEGNESQSSIVNQGDISAQNVVMIAARVLNAGAITADKGVGLAAGEAVTVSFDQDRLVSIDVDAADWQVEIDNSGIIQASDGLVLMKADVASSFLSRVVSGGATHASQAIVENGKVRLVSSQGRVAAKGVKIDAGDQGQSYVSGTVDVSSDVEQGGSIEITGGSVKIAQGALLNADGATGGGQVQIGGSWQGQDVTVRQAETTTIEQGAKVTASATGKGDGGTIVVWSDITNANSLTKVDGELVAEAKGLGHIGGSIETSGHQVLIGDNARMSTKSEQGETGQWLIDPNDYTIAATGGNITGTTLSTNLASSNIIIETATMGTAGGSGDIHVNDDVSWSANTLTLTAERDININAVMTASGTSTLDMTANANSVDDGDPFDPNNSGDQTRTALRTIGRVRVGMGPNEQGFLGRVDFTDSASLSINGDSYTLIYDLANLEAVTINNASVRYALANDIDAMGVMDSTFLTNSTGSLIGGTSTLNFKGVLDGLGHTVSNMAVSSTGDTYSAGLFGAAQDATVRNVGVTDIVMTGRSGSVGGLIGSDLGGNTIHNTYSTGAFVPSLSLASTLDGIGGLIGQSRNGFSLIENSFSSVDITLPDTNSSYGTGGLIGRIHLAGTNRLLSSTYATGSLSSRTMRGLGGLVGSVFRADDVRILDSYSSGDINSALSLSISANRVGGLIGDVNQLFSSDNLLIDTVFSNGDINGDDIVGGLIGNLDTIGTVKINNAYSSGNVMGTDSVGGLIGESKSSTGTLEIDNSFSYGNIIPQDASADTGGLIGELVSGTVILNNVYWNSNNSSAVGLITAGSLSGDTATNIADFSDASLATSLGPADWVAHADYAYPILADLHLLPQFLETFNGSQIDVSIVAGGGGTARVIEGTSLFIDQSSIGVDTLSSALTNGDVIVQTGGAGSSSKVGNMFLDEDFSWSNNQLSLVAAQDIAIRSTWAPNSNAQLSLKADDNTDDFVSVVDMAADLDAVKAQVASTGRIRTLYNDAGTAFLGSINIDRDGYNILTMNGDSYRILNSMADFASLNSSGYDKYLRYAIGSDLVDGTTHTTFVAPGLYGVFDGLGHIIDDVEITTAGISGGFFQGITAGADGTSGVVRNFGLTDINVNVIGGTYTGAAALTGSTHGSNANSASNALIHNILLSGSITSGTGRAGGLIGRSTKHNIIEDIYSSLTVTSNATVYAMAGGLIAETTGSEFISGVTVTGNVSSLNGNNSSKTGGLIGSADSTDVHITKTAVTGNVTSLDDVYVSHAGGLIGSAFRQNISIDQVFTSGAVEGDNAGGLVGYLRSDNDQVIDIKNSYTTGDITATGSGSATDGNAGGLIGLTYIQSATTKSLTLDIGNSFSSSDIEGPNQGGIIGSATYSSGGFATVYTDPADINEDFTFSNTFWLDQQDGAAQNLCVVGSGGFCDPASVADGNNLFDTTGAAQVRPITSGQWADAAADLGAGFNLANTSSTSLTSLLGDSFDFTAGDAAPKFKDSIFDRYYIPSIALYIQTISGSSIYGEVFSLGYNWLDGNGDAFDLGANGITLTGSLVYSGAPNSTANAGTYNYSYGSGLSLSHASENYSVNAWGVDGVWTISPKALSISGSSAADKIYDGNTTAAITSGMLSGFVGGETLGLSASGLFADANVGTNKNITVTYTLADDTGLASNYSLAGETLQADITLKALSISGSTAADKTYDGNATAAITAGTLNGLVGVESLGLSASGEFADANAGTNKNATVTYTLSDGTGLASNYSLAGETLQADITPKALSISGSTAADKTYDGNATAAITAGTLNGLVGVESLGLSASGEFADANAGTNKNATVTYTLSDGTGLASNYSLSGETLQADITPKALSISGSTAADKTYDGNATAAIAAGTLNGLVGVESLGLSASGEFADANAGTNKNATVTYTLSDGTGLASNYSLAGETLQADITKKALSISGSSALDKAYDGTIDAIVAAGTLSGLVSGETLNVSAVGSFVDANAGVNKSVTASYTLSDGVGVASNYSGLSNQSLSADITLASPTQSFGVSNVTKSLNDPVFTYSLDSNSAGAINFVSSDPSVATVDANGTVTLVGPGSATITANQVSNGNYTAGSSDYALSVTASANTESSQVIPNIDTSNPAEGESTAGGSGSLGNGGVDDSGDGELVTFDPDSLTDSLGSGNGSTVEGIVDSGPLPEGSGEGSETGVDTNTGITDTSTEGSGNDFSGGESSDEQVAEKTGTDGTGIVDLGSSNGDSGDSSGSGIDSNTGIAASGENAGATSPAGDTEQSGSSSEQSATEDKEGLNQIAGTDSGASDTPSTPSTSTENSSEELDRNTKDSNELLATNGGQTSAVEGASENANASTVGESTSGTVVVDQGPTVRTENTQINNEESVDQVILLSAYSETDSGSKPVINNASTSSGFTRVSALSNTTVANGDTFVVIVPRSFVQHSDPDAQVSYTATLENGAALPAWIAFDSSTLTFRGKAPETGGGVLNVVIRGQDSAGNEFSMSFSIQIAGDKISA